MEDSKFEMNLEYARLMSQRVLEKWIDNNPYGTEFEMTVHAAGVNYRISRKKDLQVRHAEWSTKFEKIKKENY